MSSIDIAGYFDYAAATPLDKDVLNKMEPYYNKLFYNPSGIYTPAREVKNVLKEARSRCAKALGAKPTEIIFTSGATESNNLAINGIMQEYPNANALVSVIEHDSVLLPAKNHKHKVCKVKKTGLIDLDDLRRKIDDRTVLVSIMLANNEIGTIQPVKKIIAIIDEVRKEREKTNNNLPIYLHTDAAQATNYIDLKVSRLGIGLMTINGGKIYGPKQTGLLYVRSGIKLNPQIVGGGQEHSLRSGTENIAGIVGFSYALEKVLYNTKNSSEKTLELRNLLINELSKKHKNIKINGSIKNRLPNNLNVCFTGYDNERTIFALDDKNYYVASGSACSASSEDSSHVLKAIGLTEKEAQSSIRISLGKYTTKKSIYGLVKSLNQVIS